MSLDEGKKLNETNEPVLIDAGRALEKWQNSPPSVISHHGRACCDVAREWVLSMDYSQLNGGSPLTGPRWIRQKFKWGPSSWPIHWCEAVQQKTLDCGALAALAHEAFVARGVTSFPAQLIEGFGESATRHWYATWGSEECSVNWIHDDLIYHEGCAVVVRDDEIKLWDATASWWINPKQFGGYGALLAVKVWDLGTAPRTGLNWGACQIVANEWQKIERERGDVGGRSSIGKKHFEVPKV